MSMRNHPSILDRIDPELDPGNLCQPMKQPKAEPICHCAPPEKGRLGGMSPVIDLGDDSKKDKVILDSMDQIRKSLNITNFDKKDRLVIGGKKYFYSDLKDDTPGNINVSFRGDSDDADVSTQSQDDFNPVSSNGFDFL